MVEPPSRSLLGTDRRLAELLDEEIIDDRALWCWVGVTSSFSRKSCPTRWCSSKNASSKTEQSILHVVVEAHGHLRQRDCPSGVPGVLGAEEGPFDVPGIDAHDTSTTKISVARNFISRLD